nr:unnamed protein product [Callosobruchus analis]
MLRDTGCLTLPHPIYLSQITADIKTDVGIKQSQIQYLKRKADILAPHEKFINILFDEIHIAPKIEYRGGVLRGLTEKNEVANKIQAFMLSSVFSKNEDIIAFHLESDLSLDPTNVDNKHSIRNHFSTNQKIFMLFDRVHLFKSITNIGDLKHIHGKECHSTVKLAPALSQKVLHPSSLERQNVSLAVLRCKGGGRSPGWHCRVLKIILSWWKIVNVRSSKAGNHLKDPHREPITSPDHDSIKSLRKFIQFLNAWEKLDVPQYCPGHTGKLTKATFTSLKYTSAAFIDLVDYLFTVNLNLHFELKYVLLGKSQTDKMEGRFGRYRFLSGSNYNISVTQLLGSEIFSLLKLNSAKFGNFSIKQFSFTDEDSHTDLFMSTDISFYLDIITSSENVFVNNEQYASLLFIAGYCSHSIIKFTCSCDLCKTSIASNENSLYILEIAHQM